jgi:hypothetical protein
MRLSMKLLRTIAFSLPLVLVGLSTAVQAQTEEATGDLVFERPQPQFWPDAAKLMADQAEILERAQKAVNIQDPIENQTTSTKLLVQLRGLDRFVERYYNNPRRLCATKSPTTLLGAAAGLDKAQVETYCTIYQLSRELTPLRNLLTQRASLFNTSRSSDTVAIFFTQPQAAPFNPRTVEQVNLGTKIRPQTRVEPLVYPQLLGRQRMKRQMTAMQPPAPAIAAPDNTMKLIREGLTKVQMVQAKLPTAVSSFQTAKPKPKVLTLKDREATLAEETEFHKAFLQQENTGIARVYPESAFVTPANRLEPNTPTTPFGLRIQNGQFVMSGNDLDYGFLTDVGDVELGKRRVKVPVPELFKTYQPPIAIPDVQKEQRRFVVGKDTEFSAQVMAALYRTYVMRLVEFDLPDIVASGRPLKPGERGNLQSLLQAVGSDRLIVFRPVSRQWDGSYTILWQVVRHNPEPGLVGLEDYISLNLQTRGRN